MPNNYAYTTLLGSDDYLTPVLGLYHSLQLTNSKYPLVVMVMDTVSPYCLDVLNRMQIQYKVFPNLQSYAPYAKIAENNNIKDLKDMQIDNAAFFQIMMMNKFYMFDLKEFDKVCYFDGDILVRDNVDFIFNYQTPAGKILLRGDITSNTDNNKYKVDKPFIAGEHILISPKDFSCNYIIKKYTIFAHDENIIANLYPRRRITHTGLSDDCTKIFHAHSHCCMFRYWEVFDLNEDNILDFCKIMMIDGPGSEQDKVLDLKSLAGDLRTTHKFEFDIDNGMMMEMDKIADIESNLVYETQQKAIEQLRKTYLNFSKEVMRNYNDNH